jgi:hypothetical protein
VGTAGNPTKRKMIEKAFFSAFDPKFYKLGMNAHFMEILAKIQYPEARFLAEQLQERNKRARHFDTNDFEGNIAYRRIEPGIADREIFHAQQLNKLGLLHNRNHTRSRETYLLLPIAEDFVEFVWDNSFFDDSQNGNVSSE